jgi:hypothetical protein
VDIVLTSDGTFTLMDIVIIDMTRVDFVSHVTSFWGVVAMIAA